HLERICKEELKIIQARDIRYISRLLSIGVMGIMGTLRLSECRGCLQTMPSMSTEKTAKQD
ncbi:MAG: hypothetical protein J6Q40_01440, partial [Tidjanibacter sp.]|nr:hypothetical protein [Tidjanibacter sp.]